MSNGLIVGFGNLDTPAHFYAYDLQCPNCFDIDALPQRNYELTVTGTGIATCKTCHRSYNLNTGGNIVSGERGKTIMYCKYCTIHLQRLQRHYFLRLLYGNFAADKYNKNGQ